MKPKVKKLDVLSMHLDCATAKQDRMNQESQAESYVFMLRTLLRLGLPPVLGKLEIMVEVPVFE